MWRDTTVIKSDSKRGGFTDGYTRWTKHGETNDFDDAVHQPVEVEVDKPHEAEANAGEAATKSNGFAGLEVKLNFDVEELLCHINRKCYSMQEQWKG